MNEIFIIQLLEASVVIFLVFGCIFSVLLTILLYRLFRLASKKPKLTVVVIFNRGKEFFRAIGIAALGIAIFNISGVIFSNLLFWADEKMMYLVYSISSLLSVFFLILPIIKVYRLEKAMKETL